MKRLIHWARRRHPSDQIHYYPDAGGFACDCGHAFDFWETI